MGARYYCPWLGRWTTADPLGLQAGINVYLYCRAGPVTLSDPSGLDPALPSIARSYDDQIAQQAQILGGIRAQLDALGTVEAMGYNVDALRAPLLAQQIEVGGTLAKISVERAQFLVTQSKATAVAPTPAPAPAATPQAVSSHVPQDIADQAESLGEGTSDRIAQLFVLTTNAFGEHGLPLENSSLMVGMSGNETTWGALGPNAGEKSLYSFQPTPLQEEELGRRNIKLRTEERWNGKLNPDGSRKLDQTVVPIFPDWESATNNYLELNAGVGGPPGVPPGAGAVGTMLKIPGVNTHSFFRAYILSGHFGPVGPTGSEANNTLVTTESAKLRPIFNQTFETIANWLTSLSGLSPASQTWANDMAGRVQKKAVP
jgi:hypothetical protein